MLRLYRALVAVLAAVVCLGVAPIATEATPGPNNDQGAQIQHDKDRADSRVEAAKRSVAAQTRYVARASDRASVAEQHYLTQLGVQAGARRTEAAAKRQLAAAHAEYDYDYQAFSAAAVSAYESGGSADSYSASSLGQLLIVDDPSAVLSAATAQDMLADHQADVVSRMALDLQRVQNAETATRAALARVTLVTARLATLRRAADAALARSKQGLTDLRAKLAKAKATQQQADKALSSFLGGWSAADPARAGWLNQHYEAIAIAVRYAPAAPRTSTWTPAMGQTVVNRALQYLGTSYAWAGGSTSGPTTGVCAAGAAKHDCQISGFDCSGLAMYAWAPYRPMAHSAAAQYSSGSVHPDPAALVPGDLVFWSSNHSVSGIHHVAIYVGDGNVIQAPQSGDIVRITPLQSVSRGYFGATRP